MKKFLKYVLNYKKNRKFLNSQIASYDRYPRGKYRRLYDIKILGLERAIGKREIEEHRGNVLKHTKEIMIRELTHEIEKYIKFIEQRRGKKIFLNARIPIGIKIENSEPKP